MQIVILCRQWLIKKACNSHCHFDHTGAVSEIAQTLGIPYCIHRGGGKYLTDARRNLSAYCGRNVYLDGAEYFDDGDTIFRYSPGSTQYVGGSEEQLYNSIYQRVLTLPENTTLYSGHTEPTTIGREKPLYIA